MNQGRMAIVVVQSDKPCEGQVLPQAILIEVTIGDRIITLGDNIPTYPLTEDIRAQAQSLINSILADMPNTGEQP